MTHAQLAELAIRSAGSQAALAKAIGAPPAFVYQWRTGLRPIPARFALPIEKATAGRVSRHDLRPDIFGKAPTTSAKKLRRAG